MQCVSSKAYSRLGGEELDRSWDSNLKTVIDIMLFLLLDSKRKNLYVLPMYNLYKKAYIKVQVYMQW